MEEVDHDKILLMGLKAHKELFPSFTRLNAHHQKLVLEGLDAKFNLAQFLQGENLPLNMSGVRHLSVDALHLFNLHALYGMVV